MNRNIKIIINSLSFIIIILALLLLYIYFLDARHTFSIIGFSLALIYLEIKNKFWANPLFIDSIEISKETIKIKHTNPMLRKVKLLLTVMKYQTSETSRKTFLPKTIELNLITGN